MTSKTAWKSGTESCELDPKLGFEVSSYEGALGTSCMTHSEAGRQTHPEGMCCGVISEAALDFTDRRAALSTEGFSQYWFEP